MIFGASLVGGMLALSSQSLMAQASDWPLQSVQMAGGLHAVARACQHYTDDELRSLKAQHKERVAAHGISASQFETVFQAHYAEARARVARADPAERDENCRKAGAMLKMMEQQQR